MSSRPDVDILVQGVMSKIKTPISNKYFKPSVAGPGLPSYKALEELEEQYPSCGIKIYNKLLKDSGAV